MLARGKFTSAIERDISHGKGQSKDLINVVPEKNPYRDISLWLGGS
jgi:hypothetical protein